MEDLSIVDRLDVLTTDKYGRCTATLQTYCKNVVQRRYGYVICLLNWLFALQAVQNVDK